MFEAVDLARLQFALTSIYHWLFVPFTLGMTVIVAALEWTYVSTGKEVYKKMAKFWGKLFLINFAMGVVTGIVQEFHFGMNWAEYSRFMGDIFGAPLALEALMAFFLESTFMGVWIFGWDRLHKCVHALVATFVALGTNLSAFCITQWPCRDGKFPDHRSKWLCTWTIFPYCIEWFINSWRNYYGSQCMALITQ